MATGISHPGVLRRVFRVVSPTCEDMTALISALMDRELPWTTRLRMRIHFSYCSYCRRVRRQFAAMRRATTALAEELGGDAELQLDEAAREKMRRALRGER